MRSTMRAVASLSTPSTAPRTSSRRNAWTFRASIGGTPVPSIGKDGLAARELHLFAKRQALVDDLHVHRVVLHEGRTRDDRDVEVVLEHALRERLEAQVAL